MTPSPTSRTYRSLDDAYAFFNERLFGGKLPPCLITMQRKANSYGFFAGGRFGSRDNKEEITDEIALNPSHFSERTTEQSLSTLVHEMVHLEQHHFGKPGRTSYHNKEWAQMMRAVGLVPSNTGNPGGKDTGQRVSHYVEAGGPFSIACAELLENFEPLYIERWSDGGKEKAKKKAASKSKYTCPSCNSNAWAKPDTNLICGDCDQRMETNQQDSSQPE